MSAKCIVCGGKATQEQHRAANQKIECSDCGVYVVSGTFNALEHSREKLGQALARAKRHAKPGMLAFISDENL